MKERKTKGAGDARAANLISIGEATRAPLLLPTVPIYQGEKRGVPQVAGSGVLVILAGIRFLLTAGHVLDLRRNGQVVVGVSPELLTLAGDPMRLRTPGSKGSSGDKIDVGVVELIGGRWDGIPVDRFLPLERLDREIPIVARHSYALVAFPNSMNRTPPTGDRLKALAISIAGLECENESYAETGTDPELNVMVGLDQRTLWTADGQRNGPDLYGSSGGGLWRYGRRIRTSTGSPKLSAIAIEWHRKGRHRHVLGTRITLVLGAIADKYPTVRHFFGLHQ